MSAETCTLAPKRCSESPGTTPSPAAGSGYPVPEPMRGRSAGAAANSVRRSLSDSLGTFGQFGPCGGQVMLHRTTGSRSPKALVAPAPGTTVSVPVACGHWVKSVERARVNMGLRSW
jgi:hypothetical protein